MAMDAKTTQEKLGRRIRQLRLQRGYTQESFEEVSGVHPQYLSALERGTKNVTLEVLERVAKGLNIELYILFLFEAEIDRPTKKNIEKFISHLTERQIGQLMRIMQIFEQE